MKLLKVAAIALISLILNGCMFGWGIGCTAGIVFSGDRVQTAQALPTARVGEYYETSIDYEGEAPFYNLHAVKLPDGLELVAIQVNESANSADQVLQGYSIHPRKYVLRGEPQTHGQYRIEFSEQFYPSMCGNNTYIYPYELKVLRALSQ